MEGKKPYVTRHRLFSRRVDFVLPKIEIRDTHPRDNQKAGVFTRDYRDIRGSLADKAAGKAASLLHPSATNCSCERTVSRCASSDREREREEDSRSGNSPPSIVNGISCALPCRASGGVSRRKIVKTSHRVECTNIARHKRHSIFDSKLRSTLCPQIQFVNIFILSHWLFNYTVKNSVQKHTFDLDIIFLNVQKSG